MENKERIHFIAIGGSVMHNLAIALHKKGHIISGSDDHFFDPSKGRLSQHGILPEEEGWNPEKITKDLDAVILGMHAKKSNPELLKAQELGIPVYSFPDYVYKQCQDKQRIVICGSHGKTTITAMILHVLNHLNKKFDYLVGAQIEGFDTMVKLTDEAPYIIIEGDEYLSSPLDKTPKFLNYNHHIAVISGISWDHINVFPSFESYVKQFKKLIANTPKAGSIIFNREDKLVKELVSEVTDDEDILLFDYKTHKSKIKAGKSQLVHDNGLTPVDVFGEHNMSNLSAAKLVCNRLCISDEDFYSAIASFKGASKRLETIGEGKKSIVFKDFAHSPSKLEATCSAVKKQFPKRTLVACMELHTFSSLNKSFLSEYKNTYNDVDIPIIYYNPKTVEAKKLELISPEEISKWFNNSNIKVFIDKDELKRFLLNQEWTNANLLFMSSGDFGGMNLNEIATTITA